jgi:polyribonucleotide nucleotidyltransferase
MSQQRSDAELRHNATKFYRAEATISDVSVTFESGRIAKQAAGAVWVRAGDSVVLVTACTTGAAREGVDFFPLTCEYIEKTYAAGRIPGGFFKRESRPREAEILNARLIDRSIRPLFPDGFCEDVQVIATVISHDGENDTDVLALNGASMALHISSIPFAAEAGPIAGIRVGRINGRFIANPTMSQRHDSDMDLMVSVSKDAIVMVEGEAKEASEADMVEALFFAHTEGQKIIAACEDMRAHLGKEKRAFVPKPKDEALLKRVEHIARTDLTKALSTKEKLERYSRLDAAKKDTLKALAAELGEEAFKPKEKELAAYFGDIKKQIMRHNMLDTKERVDGRAFDVIRPICCEVGVLPRAHGSAIFTRGETQVIVAATLGTAEDEQKIDTLLGESARRFMLHYNFPPFSVGEARPLRGSSRREIGHGALAERAVAQMAPTQESFPYTIRVVSETTESNGSSSMATVCGATLSLYDAGVKMASPVAGIAMGLIKEGEKIAILSDILGDEDHLGDMDFKVCGTAKGVTAIQMDIKIHGLSRQILTDALEQARKGRLHILEQMLNTLPTPREDLSPFAPRITTLRVHPDRIRDVIGPGGRIIRDIIARSGAKVDISDDGVVNIAAVGLEPVRRAIQMIEDLTREAEVNKVYRGLVKRVVDFGAFVELFPGTEGLCHISELADNRVNQVTDVLQEGDEVLVAVLSIDREGKIRLSRKRAMGKKAGDMISPA